MTGKWVCSLCEKEEEEMDYSSSPSVPGEIHPVPTSGIMSRQPILLSMLVALWENNLTCGKKQAFSSNCCVFSFHFGRLSLEIVPQKIPFFDVNVFFKQSFMHLRCYLRWWCMDMGFSPNPFQVNILYRTNLINLSNMYRQPLSVIRRKDRMLSITTSSVILTPSLDTYSSIPYIRSLHLVESQWCSQASWTTVISELYFYQLFRHNLWQRFLMWTWSRSKP